MFGALMWGWLMLSLGFGVALFGAAWLREGSPRRAALLVLAFVGVVGLTGPVRAAWPVGYTNMGASSTGPAGSGTAVMCEPGTATRFVIGWAGFDDAGTCPESGSFTCDQSAYYNFSAYSGGYCYVEAAGTGGGEEPGTSVSLKPFDMPAEDGALISAAIVAVWCSGWGIRAVIDTLRDRKDGD